MLRTAAAATVGASLLSTGATAQSPSEGELLWQFETEADSFSAGVRAEPTVVDGVVYACSRDGYLYAIDAGSGDEVWRFEVGTWPDAAPQVVDGLVYVGSRDARVHAVDVDSGEEVWNAEVAEWAVGVTVVDGVAYVTTADITAEEPAAYAFDATDGEELWSVEFDNSLRSEPIVYDGRLYFGSNGSQVYALDPETGDELWRSYVGESVRTAVTAANGAIFVAAGASAPTSPNVVALDAETGDELWVVESPNDFSSGGPTIARETLYVNNGIDVLALDPTNGAELWTFRAPDELAFGSAPTVAGDTVFVGNTDDNLYAIDAATGEERWHFDGATGRIEVGPTVVDGVVYFGSEDGNVYAVQTGVDGSSEGSRVLLGAKGHHGDWTGDPSAYPDFELGEFGTVEPPTEEPSSDGDSTDATGDDGSDAGTDETMAAESPTEQSGDDGMPGPGIVGALAAMGGAGYLLSRRADEER